MGNELMTIKRAAEYTGYSTAHLRVLVKKGKIKAIKPNGGKLIIREDDLNVFLQGAALNEADGSSYIKK